MPKATMLFDHLQKLIRFPKLGLMVLAAALVVVCQLLAMVMVGGNPLQSSGVRDLQQAALADCIQRSISVSRHSCIRQSQLESDDRDRVASSPADEGSVSINHLFVADEAVTRSSADKLRVAVAR